MNWTHLVARVADRTGAPQTQVRAILGAMGEVATEALLAGEDVTLRPLGTLKCAWTVGRTLRTVSEQRKVRLDGRYVVRFRPSRGLRGAVADRTPQRWRDPAHQAAWRAAETLLSDLALYHGARAPGALPADADDDAVHAACRAAFGGLWDQARRAYAGQVQAEVTDDYLAEAARRKFRP